MDGKAKNWQRKLWLEWVAANAIGEGVGLGGSALAMLGFITLSGESESIPSIIGMALVAVLLGTLFEGVVVGLAQGAVLRRVVTALPFRRWVVMTALGAGIAWTLGMTPSTIMSIVPVGAEAAAETAAEGPPDWLVYLLASAMGLVLGPMLATPQYFVLRKFVNKAGWWIPANALGWMLALPLTFIAPGMITPGAISIGEVVLIVGTVLLAGAIVGAVHGIALVRLLDRHRKST